MSSKNGKQVFSVFEIYPKNKKCEGICSVEFDCCVFFVYHYICGCKRDSYYSWFCRNIVLQKKFYNPIL